MTVWAEIFVLLAVCLVCSVATAAAAAGDAPADGSLMGPPAGLHAQEELFKAIDTNDVAGVRKVLAKLRADGRALPAPDRHGRTALHEAAQYSSGPEGEEIISLLVEAGADPNAQNVIKETPLHFAGFNENGAGNVRALVKHGAKLDARDEDGSTPLHDANGAATTQAMLDAGADPRAVSDTGASPLHGSSTDVAALVKAGADPNAADRDGFTPLHFAAYTARADRAKALIAANAKVNPRTTKDYFRRPPGTPKEFADDPTDDVPAGSTPLDIARRKHDAKKWVTGKYRDVVEVLERAGGKTVKVRTFPWRMIGLGLVLVSFAMFAGLLMMVAKFVRR